MKPASDFTTPRRLIAPISRHFFPVAQTEPFVCTTGLKNGSRFPFIAHFFSSALGLGASAVLVGAAADALTAGAATFAAGAALACCFGSGLDAGATGLETGSFASATFAGITAAFVGATAAFACTAGAEAFAVGAGLFLAALTTNQRDWNDGRITLDGLSGVDLDLRLSAANVVMSNAKLGRTAIGANLRGGHLVVTIGEAQAYGGVIKGSLSVANFKPGRA